MSSCQDFAPTQAVKTIAYGPTPTFVASDCSSFTGTPILPPSSDGFRCASNTPNRTLMTTCCGDAPIGEYLGCLLHCAVGTGLAGDVTSFVDCISTGEDVNATSQDIQSVAWDSFCQGVVNSTSQTSGGSRMRLAPGSFLTLLTTVLAFLTFCGTAAADCTFSIQDNSTHIQQGMPRRVSQAGIGCTGPANGGPENYCSTQLSGEIMTDHRTINGTDASDGEYDTFFEVLGRAIVPSRRFPASISFTVPQWEPTESDSTTWTWWASWNYCLRGTASECEGVNGLVEACGPLSHGTGFEENQVPQGVFLKETVLNDVIAGPGVCSGR